MATTNQKIVAWTMVLCSATFLLVLYTVVLNSDTPIKIGSVTWSWTPTVQLMYDLVISLISTIVGFYMFYVLLIKRKPRKKKK